MQNGHVQVHGFVLNVSIGPDSKCSWDRCSRGGRGGHLRAWLFRFWDLVSAISLHAAYFHTVDHSSHAETCTDFAKTAIPLGNSSSNMEITIQQVITHGCLDGRSRQERSSVASTLSMNVLFDGLISDFSLVLKLRGCTPDSRFLRLDLTYSIY